MASILGIVRDWLGCVAGALGYGLVKAASTIAGGGEPRRLADQTKAIMSEFFPELDLNEVVLRTGASIVPRRFRAMTLGRTIFLRGDLDECSAEDMLLLVHELVHVDQFRRLGELKFACAYGEGFLRTFSHDNIPLEREATAFQHAHETRLRYLVLEALTLR